MQIYNPTYKNKHIDLPEGRLRVYKNLRRHCYSVCIKSGGRWLVSTWADELALRDVRFIVSPSGNARVRREQCKHVHAYAEGYAAQPTDVHFSPHKVTYDPYQHTSFQVISRTFGKLRGISSCHLLNAGKSGLWALTASFTH